MKRKKLTTRKHRIKKTLNRVTKGKAGLYVVLILAALGFAFLSVSGSSFPRNTDQEATPTPDTPTVSGGTCCESGDGEDCRPLRGTGETIQYDGQGYGLLKRNVSFSECIYHLGDSGEKTTDGDPIILNTSDRSNGTTHPDIPECLGGDALITEGTSTSGSGNTYPNCLVVPNEQLIYVCRENCTSSSGSNCNGLGIFGITCYGQPHSRYDVYFRLADDPAPGVPDEIRFCKSNAAPQQPNPNQTVPQQILTPPQGDLNQSKLNINTFGFGEVNPAPQADSVAPWMSPWCKPAIYLYPEKETQVHVRVEPQGKMTYTDPPYPTSGWNVIAYPDGQLKQTNNYEPITNNYLYYEAEIPDSSYSKPSDGYVVTRDNLEVMLNSLLPKLGLNNTEIKEFVTYWRKVLPVSPYYFIGIVPHSHLDFIAPLSISPKPQSVIRVTLYFEALDSFKSVNKPVIQTPVRTGFTVVEWGGLFKKDPKHPFSCFM